MENITNNEMPISAALESPAFTKIIDGTTYKVTVRFSQSSKETLSDKIKHLIQNDFHKMNI